MAEISTSSVLLSLFYLLFGSLILYLGAEGLVRGSSSLALRMRISSLVIGLTVVSLGTSSPELIVSLLSALEGNSSIAVGNVIGSNICNVALILGLSALFSPIKMDFKEISRDIYIMLIVSIALLLVLLDGQISMLEGAMFTIGIILYIILTIYFSRRKNIKSKNLLEDIVILNKKVWFDIFLIIGSLILLVMGANGFLIGAKQIALFFGASDALIGLTLVAIGTSLPELATSLVASIKKKDDISVGNVIGSNIFNILCILGIVSLIHPLESKGITNTDIFVMFGTSALVLVFAFWGAKISRARGAFLLFCYIAYMGYLIAQM